MKFKLKALAVAVAFATVGVQAQAADTSTAGGSDLLFFVYDSAQSNSFVMDLGLAGLFNPGTTASINQAVASSAWSSFVAADANWMANAQWGVVNASAGPVGTSWIGSTVKAGASTAGIQATATSNAIGSVQTLFTNNVFASGSTTYSTGGGSNNAFTTLVNTSGNADYFGPLFSANNAVGATGVNFVQALTKTGRGSADVLSTYGSTFAFNGSTLTYNVAAVPEPETYGMLAAGLLMLGAVARRRKV